MPRIVSGATCAYAFRIRSGATAWEAALRELAEETGLAPSHFYHLDAVESFCIPAEDAVLHCPAFAAEVSSDAVVRLNEGTRREYLRIDVFNQQDTAARPQP